MDGDGDELSVDQGNVDPAVGDHPGVRVGNGIQIVLEFSVANVRTEEFVPHGLAEKVPSPLDGVPGDLVSVTCDLVHILQLLLLQLGHQSSLYKVIVCREPPGHL